MQLSRNDVEASQIATIDIETTHYDPTEGETVAIGIGVHDRETPASEIEYELFYRSGEGEASQITRALGHLNELGADRLVSYNGKGFDLSFLEDRLSQQGTTSLDVDLDNRHEHVDLYEPRKQEADKRNVKWPSLEECLQSYDYKPPTTIWKGTEIGNTVFGEELGPAYLQAVADGDRDRQAALADVIDHYLRTDLEANLALYYADIGASFEPDDLETTAEFDM
jgi:hypothetical protein